MVVLQDNIQSMYVRDVIVKKTRNFLFHQIFSLRRQCNMNKTLTVTMKQKYLPLILERDGGYICFYCKQALDPMDFVYEHLNGKRLDNRIENIVLAHQSCNVKKVTNFDYQIIAKEKLEVNEKICLSERKFSDSLTDHQSSSEIGISIKTFQITHQYLEEHISTDGFVLFEDALWSIVFKARKETNYGSHQAVRAHINALTCQDAPFEMKRDSSNKKIIVKRIGN